MARTPFACVHANEDVKIRFGATWYGFPHDLCGRDDDAYVGLVAPQGFSLGSHVTRPGGLESHTAGGLKRTVDSAPGRAVFPVFLHNSGLNSFLCDQGVRALESHGYSSVVGRPPGFVSPRFRPKLVATGSQHSMHSPKKKKKKDRHPGEDNSANVRSDAKGREMFVRLCQAWAFW